MVDGIIFDLDGTLWDATELVAVAWSRAAKKYTGVDPKFTKEQIGACLGKLLIDIAVMLFPDCTKEQHQELIELCIEEEHKELQVSSGVLYPGLEETLKELKKTYPLYIVSNCQAGYIEDFLAATGFSHYFADHLCPGDTGNPKGDNIMEIVEKHQMKSPVYVGDTQGDYEATIKAKVPFIYAAYGFGEVEGYHKKIDSFCELPTIMKEL
ncbi:phosphoglycolate phosphatase [Aequitasia blattaphilus]|uniref:HAD family hydrolase n=1 Tax=Aequitasia blattaphilus TaxID=2949332 RepID=A0ABT1E5S7_9FIRM|nr:HAD family hydrolase [Aequitasia blattaphilus]MCP1100929.1 HAD family hydrolase [Aequitasia blattaphilus]MCR8613569.1 HAD family hydrolase [Aequitasia blattaphilus]